MTPRRGELWWVRLDPTEGSEIRKTRRCLVLTSDVLDRLRRTVVVVPYSSSAGAHPPVTVADSCQERVNVTIVNRVRAIARERLTERIGQAPEEDLAAVLRALAEILEMP